LNRKELNCDDKIVLTSDENNQHHMPVSVTSLHSYKCVITKQEELIPFFIDREVNSHHHLAVIILSNLHINTAATTTTTRDLIISEHHLLYDNSTIYDNQKLFINVDKLSDLSFYGYMENIASPQNITSDVLKAFIDDDSLSYYANSIGYENPTIMVISGIYVGIVLYDMLLVERGIFTSLQLQQWILKESICLHNKRSDIVIVIGNGDTVLNEMILNHYKTHLHKSKEISHKLLTVGIYPTGINALNLNASISEEVLMINLGNTIRVDLNITRTIDRIVYTYKSNLVHHY